MPSGRNSRGPGSPNSVAGAGLGRPVFFIRALGVVPGFRTLGFESLGPRVHGRI